MSVTAPFLAPVPSYDDDAFVLTERVPRIVIECSRANPLPRIHEVSAPTVLGLASTIPSVPGIDATE